MVIANNLLRKICGAVVLCIGLSLASYSSVSAIDFEQQINIIDQEYFTVNTSDSPGNSSLGLVQFDPANFSGATVYFEAVMRCDTCSGGNSQASVSLYTEGGSSPVSLTTGSSTYTLVRSGSVSLSSDNYSVRIKVDAVSGTAYVKAARLVIVQNAGPLTNTKTFIEVGNKESFSVSTSAVTLSDPKIFLYERTNYSDITSITFAATVWGSSSGYVASACLYTVGGSEVGCVGTNSTIATYPTPVSVTLTDNTEYVVRLKTDSGATQNVNLANAHIIITQSQSMGIRKLATHHHLINTLANDYDSSYTLQDTFHEYNPAHYSGGSINAYFEAVLKANTGTAYAKLYNTTDTADISNSEVSHNSNTYTRKRTNDIASALPGSTKNIDVAIKNSGLNTTSISGSWFIVKLTLPPSFSFSIDAVGASTVNNGITTSVSSTYSTLPFANISVGQPRYAAHKLTVTANTNDGYQVTAYLASSLQGIYPGDNIDPFAAPSATWTNPVAWYNPTGTTKNVDTGWFAANTTDTRVSGWGSGAQKFGPFGTSPVTVMQSSGSDSGTSIYVTYALGVNVLQPADLYSGMLVYNILPSY